MEYVVVWTIVAVLIGVAANSRGRSGIGWFFLAMIISPLIAGLLLMLFGTPASALAKTATPTAGAEVATPETHVRCPECRELVRKDARKCKHCGTALVPQTDS